MSLQPQYVAQIVGTVGFVIGGVCFMCWNGLPNSTIPAPAGGGSGSNPDLVKRRKPVAVQADIIPASLPRLTTMMRQSGLLDANVDLRTKNFI